ncbi:hypothetical protein [Puniceicoccus vermicola]|uniref:Uncharacterized protein n=1 Tax=Puniceicoccus vermicola TaxID=388746 RepID=A0A7X1AZA8_9BACT|nr:hypothetical protein [Puniceicoccus vermicola]MBC2602716.1 hypothetical protein [Puniceicoccus vermicola]
MIKAQDVIVALDLCRFEKTMSTYAERGSRLGMSASEVHAAVRRLEKARLLDPETGVVRRIPLIDFLEHGVPYAFAERPGEVTRGIPTAWAAPVMADRFTQNSELPPVWPDPEGKTQGIAVRPLYRSVPKASQRDSGLYDLFALVDALRIGRARDRKIAKEVLKEKLLHHTAA